MTTTQETAAPEEKPVPLQFPASGDGQAAVPTKIGVMIATPLREYRGQRDLPPQIGRAIRELVGRSDAAAYSWEFAAAVGGLCRARNNCVDEFLRSPNKWLLWWDRDLHDQSQCEADAVLRLLSHRQPLVGGLYCKRERRPRWVANWLTPAKIQVGGTLQVAELGCGFSLHHRKVFEEVRRIFGDEALKRGDPSILYRERETGEMIAGFYQNLVLDGDLLSEDYWFQYLCRCAKIPIMADTQIRLRHVDHDGEVYPPKGSPWPPIPAEDAR